MTLFSDSEWNAIADRSVEDFRTLLRFETVNPPGNEGEAADWIVQRLAESGVESRVFRCGPDQLRPNVVARLKGDGTGGGPLLLTGHIDVVPVELEHWDHDPFGAEIHDGYLFGRGAIDMKNMVTMCLTITAALRESGARLTRDIIFAAVADEEEGCTYGSKYMVEEHPDEVRAEYMLGEIGGFTLDVNGVRYYPVQVAEKGICQFRMSAHGDPGHGSMPHDAMSTIRLAEALTKLGTTRLPQHEVATVRENIRLLAKTQKAPASLVLPLVLNPKLSALILKKVIPDRGLANTLAANLSNTVSVTGLRAGQKTNMIPGTSTATLDGRLLPGQTSQDLFREVEAVVGSGFTYETIREFEGIEGGTDDPFFEKICANIRRHDPDGIPLPYMIPGFTDAQYFSRLGTKCYGYSPLRFPAEDEVKFTELFHGHNERIHVEGYRWGLRCLWDLVVDVAVAGD